MEHGFAEKIQFGKFTKPLITFITPPSIPLSQATSAQRGTPSYTYFAYTAGKEHKLRAPRLQLIWICLTQGTCSPIWPLWHPSDTVRRHLQQIEKLAPLARALIMETLAKYWSSRLDDTMPWAFYSSWNGLSAALTWIESGQVEAAIAMKS